MIVGRSVRVNVVLEEVLPLPAVAREPDSVERQVRQPPVPGLVDPVVPEGSEERAEDALEDGGGECGRDEEEAEEGERPGEENEPEEGEALGGGTEADFAGEGAPGSEVRGGSPPKVGVERGVGQQLRSGVLQVPLRGALRLQPLLDLSADRVLLNDRAGPLVLHVVRLERERRVAEPVPCEEQNLPASGVFEVCEVCSERRGARQSWKHMWC